METAMTTDPATAEQALSALSTILVQFGVVTTLVVILVTALLISVGIWIVARMMRVQAGYWICVMSVVIGAVIGTVAMFPLSLALKGHEYLGFWLPWVLQAVITAAILMRFIGVGLFKTFLLVFFGEIVAIILVCLVMFGLMVATGKPSTPGSSSGASDLPRLIENDSRR